MILAKFKDSNGVTSTTYLFYSIADFNTFMFSPDIESRFLNAIELKTTGKTYQERKNNFREKIIEINIFDDGGLYYSELISIYTWIENNAKKYGMIKELKENGIL